jgi:hypothetical protein
MSINILSSSRAFGNQLIKYSTGGTFTLEECYIGYSEPFNRWGDNEKGWKSNFITLSEGSFVFSNSDFVGIVVSDNSFITVNVNSTNLFSFLLHLFQQNIL